MKKFIPFEKLSKKEQQKLNLQRRRTWGDINPVTRRPENSKAYRRTKCQRWREKSDAGILIDQICISIPLTSTPSSARMRM